jgi:hypothetical protein
MQVHFQGVKPKNYSIKYLSLERHCDERLTAGGKHIRWHVHSEDF